MTRDKIFRRAVSMVFIAAILLLNAVSHAEIYSAEGSYVMSEVENLKVAKERAKANAMRYACEQAGVYVKSYSLMKNFNLEADVIETMTANIIKLVEEPHFYPLEEVANMGGVLIRVTIKAQIEDSDISRWMNKDSQQISELVSQNDALRKANAEQERKIAELKRQLAANPQDTEQIAKKFADEDKIFLSNQKVAEGWKLWDKKDFNGAVKLFDEAIELNPNNAEAWGGRGTAYYNLKQYDRAIQDYNTAIELNPNYSGYYKSRGRAYNHLKQYEQAIKDFNKAIELNPKDFNAYHSRANVYLGLKKYEQAILDCNKAIELDPVKRYTSVYYILRGICYQKLGDNIKAQADFAKAKELGYEG